MKKELEEFSKIILALEKQVRALEILHRRASSLEDQITKNSGGYSFQDVTSRINAVQNLVDRIEIEVDNLEMRVSSIEYMGFRLRTGGL